ncbi:MAG: hypothetical protein NTV36_02055 [Candidatus Staskawiczbacteria bacterium]|nr:hypothetical protein [Candidatus Staskawiczbacteria bacterium]
MFYIENEINMVDNAFSMDNLSVRWGQSLGLALSQFCSGQVPDNYDELISKGSNMLELATVRNLSTSAPYKFVLITAPSAVGKGTIGRILESNGILRIPRTITRARRPNEAETDYHFVNQDEYDRIFTAGEFLCPTDFSTSATSCAGIEKKIFFSAIESGRPFYIDSGSGTAMQIKQEPMLSNIRFAIAFILPPTFEEMVSRMIKRINQETTKIESGVVGKSMNESIMRKRLLIATEHLAQSVFYADLFVVNDEPNRATAQILRLFS